MGAMHAVAYFLSSSLFFMTSNAFEQLLAAPIVYLTKTFIGQTIDHYFPAFDFMTIHGQGEESLSEKIISVMAPIVC